MKKQSKSTWKPVSLDGSIFTAGIDGLVGIEECTDYNLVRKEKNLKSACKVKANVIKKPCKKKRKLTTELKDLKKFSDTKKKKKNLETNDKNEIDYFSPSLSGGSGFKEEIVKENFLEESKVNKIKNPSLKKSNNNSLKETKKNILNEMKGLEAWDFIPLPKPLLLALSDLGFDTPTEIQSLTLPPAILGRRDILGAAETGSGKTLAFGLPILTGILKCKENSFKKNNDGEKGNLNENDTESEEDKLESEENEQESEEYVSNGKEEKEPDSENILKNAQILFKSEESSSKSEEGTSSNEDFDFEDSEFKYEELGCVHSINNIHVNNNITKKPLYALILTPTRELAMQVKNHLVAAAKYTDIKVAVIVGGMATVKQERILKKGPEIVVATPGRLWELIQDGNMHLSQIEDVRYLAIDETDRMLERGHFQELHQILERLNSNIEKMKKRQNFVFSATLTLVHELPRHILTKKKLNMRKKVKDMSPVQKLQKLVEILGITNPKVIDITKGKGTSSTLTECRITCGIEEKDYYVYYFLQRHPGRTLIFCNSIGCVKRLNTLLGFLGCNPMPLHASMQQRQRLKNLDKFREKENSILIATDVAARGLDIPSIEHVIHYQTPRTSESYVHRSGRTARASRDGITILLVEPSELQNYLRLCRTLGKAEDIPLFPVQENFLAAVKQRVNLARELDKLDLMVRKTNSEAGWLEKAAEEMDMILDENVAKYDKKDSHVYKKKAEMKRKQLSQLLSKPIFPKGYSSKYPLFSEISGAVFLQDYGKNERAVDVMKNTIGNYSKKMKGIGRRKAKGLFKPRIKDEEHDIKLKRNITKSEKK